MQQSKYDGKPLIKAKIPYEYKVKKYKPDPSLSRIERTSRYLNFVQASTREYIWDLVYFRKKEVAWKTAEFVKRNYNVVKYTLQHILYELRKMKESMRQFNRDVKFAVKH